MEPRRTATTPSLAGFPKSLAGWALLGATALPSCADPAGRSPVAGAGREPAVPNDAGEGPAATRTLTKPAAAASAQPPAPDDPEATPVHGYRVVAELPHDPRAFTQGLLYADGGFYESTGKWGLSSVRFVEPETGRVLRSRRLASALFGEGLALVDRQLIQLTWTSRLAIVYDAATFEPVGQFRYEDHEGWGLCYDGQRLILSDGSSTLRFLHPASFAPLGTLRVTDRGRPVDQLNELEWIEGEIWANVWHSDRIARIDPRTGAVKSWVDLTGIIDLEPELEGGEAQNVLNGIAWDAAGRRLFVTGKHWPKIFQIEVVEAAR
jgi:glutamine cyclotransferase